MANTAEADTSRSVVTVHSVGTEEKLTPHRIQLPAYDKERHEDVAFLTAMTMVLMGNYSQTGHYGGPLAYTPYNVAIHLGGPELGGLTYDIREPKHPFADKFMLAGGHCIPTCYSLWMILYEAMLRRHAATGDNIYSFDPAIAILPIDALGFRRSPDAVSSLLADNGLDNNPLFEQVKLRGIRALQGHSETTDVTNDVNGGPSGVGVSGAAGKAMFWDTIGAPSSLKVIAMEGEFALTEGHAQEMKTTAVAQQVGKRLRILFSNNNAGIDDRLIAEDGVIKSKYKGYDLAQQWSSYGWNVFSIGDGNDFDEIFGVLKTMEDWPESDRRPMIVCSPTLKGWWPAAVNGKITGDVPQLQSYASHPYAIKMNSPYFVALAETFEKKYGVEFVGIRDGAPSSESERLVQFMTNMQVAMSVLDKRDGLGEWITDRLIDTAGRLDRNMPVRIETDRDPFRDERLRVENLPTEPVDVTVRDSHNGKDVSGKVELFQEAGKKLGTRRAISEIGKWINYVTGNRFYTMAADLSGSINIESINFLGHYDPESNPEGTRLKAPIQEAANAATIAGLVGQTVSSNPAVHAGHWGVTGTYGSFTPLFYTPARIFSQQNQDSPFALGVMTILAGHSGPETAADARSHFGIFAPQVWTLFPRNQIINLYFWDYNDVAPGYFAAVQKALETKEVGIITIHVARPDFYVADRNKFADTDLKAAAKGIYLIRDYDPDKPPMGTVLAQGSSSTMNLLNVIPRLEEEGINVRIAAVISTELFDSQPDEYKKSVLPDSARYDCMVVSTMTKRVPPVANLGPLTEEYSLYADFDDRWRNGGTEPDVIAEARLDKNSIFEGVARFARERSARIARLKEAFDAL